MTTIRRTLVAGLVSLLPLVVTLWLLKAIFSSLVETFRVPLTWVSERLGLGVPPYWELALASGLATLLLLLATGLLVNNFLGRHLLLVLDEIMGHIPVAKGIYGATKQLMGAIQNNQGGGFKEVVLVEWPHAGSCTLGFVARRDCSWAMEGGERRVAVYIPTAPNPTSGYVVMLEEAKIRPTRLRPEDAFTWVVSGGLVTPGGVGDRPEEGTH